jgi:type IV pilus assembly protein PilX
MLRSEAMRRFSSARRAQRGVVLFVSMILLLILTLLGISMARMQTVEERLAQNDFNHQLALQTSEAALNAAYDDDADGMFNDFSGATTGLRTLADEAADTDLAYHAQWGSPGTDSIVYNGNGAPLVSAPSAAQPQFVVEKLVAAAPPGCGSGNPGSYGGSNVYLHRLTAHAAGGDGSASATVQLIHIGGC